MNEKWIYEQTDLNVAQFDKAMELHYPESAIYINDPQKHIDRLCVECNYLVAVKMVDWPRYLTKHSSILDVGCGGGWLTAYLTRSELVNTIYALDSSKHYLYKIMPRVVELMKGAWGKVITIEGFFTPLLIQDGLLDSVVASSALHHADNLEAVLKEIRRVLKKDGVLFILNETPLSAGSYIWTVVKWLIKLVPKLLFRTYRPSSPSLSVSSFLYDEKLGDRIYPLWFWLEAIKRSGFVLLEIMDTGLPTVKNTKGPPLTHFICKAVDC